MNAKPFFTVLLLLVISSIISDGHAENRSIIRNTADLSHASGKLGAFRALVIGIDDYKDTSIPDLQTAANDARAVGAVLQRRYGFKVTYLLNRKAGWNAIDRGLRRLAENALPNDSVLIYYAGHGERDIQFDDGWWIPADARAGQRRTFIDNTLVQKAMRSIKARHVLLIADSCYAGTLFGQRTRAMPETITDKYYLSIFKDKSRWGMTSGGDEPVADLGGGGHSIFAAQLLKTLKRNPKPYLSAYELFKTVAPVVMNETDQEPQCRPIRGAGGDRGEFVFVSLAPASTPEPLPSENQTPLPPSSAEIGDYDAVIKKRQKVKAQWKRWQQKMEAEYAKAQRYDQSDVLTAQEKAAIWADFKARFQADNRFSTQDEKMLNKAAARHRYWRKAEITMDSKPVTPTPTPTPGRRKKITNSLDMEFVYIPDGEFMMGSPADEPKRDDDETLHKVILTQGFYMQTTEVTQGQWRAVMGSDPPKLRFKNCGDDCPVERVSWNDVQKFIKKLNQKEGTNKYRLPTEAQWEYACRAGTQTPFAFGNCLSADQANYDGNYPMPNCSEGTYREKTIAVKSFEPNAWGLYDMHGNVWEWCQDWYGDYPSGKVTDPRGSKSGSPRVVRGGGWDDDARGCRSAGRGGYDPDGRGYDLGFRLLRTP